MDARVKLIAQKLSLDLAQAEIIAEIIADIPDERLNDFFVYRREFYAPMRSERLITIMAANEYKKQLMLYALASGSFRFKSIEAMIDFIQKNYKSQKLCYGAKPFYDFVILGLDESGSMVNYYCLNEFNKPSRLNCDEEGAVYRWLYNHQERIGVVKYIDSKAELSRIQTQNTQLVSEPTDPDAKLDVSPKLMPLLEQITKRISSAKC